jgi:hypothetical protein
MFNFKKIKKNQHLTKLSVFILFLSFLYCLLFRFEILTDYLYFLEFVIIRLLVVLILLILLQVLLDLPFAKGFQEELQIFNQNPKNKPFVVLLRRYHFQLFLLAYISFSLATTYFVENFMVSYVLGVLTFISIILYLVQFVVYMTNYVGLQIKGFTSSVTSTKPFTRGISIATTMTAKNAQKIAVVCIECLKVGVQVGLGAEIG